MLVYTYEFTVSIAASGASLERLQSLYSRRFCAHGCKRSGARARRLCLSVKADTRCSSDFSQAAAAICSRG